MIFFTIRVECCNFLILYESFLTINLLLIDATDRSKISSDHHISLSFFQNTLFQVERSREKDEENQLSTKVVVMQPILR